MISPYPSFLSPDLFSSTRVQTLTHESVKSLEFVQSFGIDLSNVIITGGHSVARTHREPERADGQAVAVGYDLMTVIINYIAKNTSISVLTNTKAIELMEDDFTKGHL